MMVGDYDKGRASRGIFVTMGGIMCPVS